MDENTRNVLRSHGLLSEIFSPDQAKEFDRFTIDDLKIDSKLLIENAGSAIARHIQKQYGKRNILVFAGPGNNGADALVAARHLLNHDLNTEIILINHDKANDNLTYQIDRLKNIKNYYSLKNLIISDKLPKDVTFTNSVIIDGIFGAGLNGPPKGDAKEAILFINRNHSVGKNIVISIDIPSGLLFSACKTENSVVLAHETLTFEALKPVHISEPTKSLCGKSYVLATGIFKNEPIKTFFFSKRKTLSELLLPIKPTSHKGDFGHVLIYEGNPRYYGASRLCAQSALRVGAALVTLACESLEPKAFDLVEFMRAKKSSLEESFLQGIDALVVGPGLSGHSFQDEALNMLNSLKANIPFIVIDADGLWLLKNRKLALFNKTIVATPHPKEAASLIQASAKDIEADRFSALNELAKITVEGSKIIWVLKGATTLVRDDNGDTYVFKGELPILSVGGSGDVLSGAIAGFYKQSTSPLAAVLLAVSLQIESAKHFSKYIAKGLLPSELASSFPKFIKRKP